MKTWAVLFTLALLWGCARAQSQPLTSDKQVIVSPDFPKVLGPYWQAVVAGGFVFVAARSRSIASQE
jgi:hypothetical protein